MESDKRRVLNSIFERGGAELTSVGRGFALSVQPADGVFGSGFLTRWEGVDSVDSRAAAANWLMRSLMIMGERGWVGVSSGGEK